MADLDEENTEGSPRGARRRDVLLGATGLVAAAAITGAMSDGIAHAAAGPSSGQIETLGQFDVLAFSWGASNSGSSSAGGGGGAGKANVQDVSVTKFVDALSPLIFRALVTGQHLPSATIAFAVKGAPALRLLLETVLITSQSTGGSNSDTRLTENITINFAKVTFTVDGVSSSFDVTTGT